MKLPTIASIAARLSSMSNEQLRAVWGGAHMKSQAVMNKRRGPGHPSGKSVRALLNVQQAVSRVRDERIRTLKARR